MNTKYSLLSIAILAAGLQVGFAEVKAPDEPMSIWFTKPASRYLESGPIGNGRLGAMDLGGIEEQRVVLNESTMWSGGPYRTNRDGAWKCLPEVRTLLFKGEISDADALLKQHFRYPDGVKGWFDANQFGCYQILGDLFIQHEYKSENEVSVTSPSGHAQGDGKTIKNATDGSIGTKWCVQNSGKLVYWQVTLPEKRTIKTYSLASAEDVPARDPQEWELEGSMDGTTWTTLDSRKLEGPFETRLMRKTFSIKEPGEYTYYRFSFIPRISYFQVAEITLGDLLLDAQVSAPDYRRDLDLMRGVARTTFTMDGVKFTRELVASKESEVIAMHVKADKPGSLTFTAALSRRQNVTVKADGQSHSISGQLPFNKPGGGSEGI